ncbi:CPBP family intramembrane glutamic endopeptidase [Pseudochryseolinea flava]|uniref:CPBP family intramembrane metalloprotease n=1 Tax=Pseudochryseolinea flava TaxID=2059302 RepID=A0A364YAS8_9BACT|nr:CPBP family intramembrane glutamic endopeptidase [Pseudochryseolinea flava]RAW03465.1 CPBP family intramembrane metalloprotease [Pseudochryseolinea flava]
METTRRPFHPVLNILLLFAFAFAGQLIGFFLGLYLAAPFFDGSMDELQKLAFSGNTEKRMWLPLMIVQGCAAIFGFIILPIVLMRTRFSINSLWFRKKILPTTLALVVLIVLSFMVVDSVIAVWNKNIDFPSWMDGFESWAKELEDSQAKTSMFLTQFDDVSALLIGLIVVALIPGIGEEVLFRGFLQNEFYRGTKNIHVAIWLSAFLFSAIHFQFFGFVPRLLLGALFGYLYHWSGSIWTPIVAHFVNNGVIVIAIYVYQHGNLAVDPNAETAAPWAAVAGAAIIFVLLLVYFKKLTDAQPLINENSDTNPSPSID